MPASPLRVALFLGAYLLTLLAASVPKGMAPPRYADLVWGAVASLAPLALSLGVLARELRSPREAGLAPDAWTIGRLLGGTTIGLTVYGATLLLLSLMLGPIQFAAPHWPTAQTWVVSLASYLALSSMEELGFRGYALRTLVRAMGVWPAQLAIALAFGASHLLFGWARPTIVLGVIPSELLFGVAALRSGGLAMPIGLHAALNVAQWMVGEKDTAGIWTPVVDPGHIARLTTYAPFVGMGVTLLAAVLIALWPARVRSAPFDAPRPVQAV